MSETTATATPILPSVLLETERLTLRAFVEADIDAVFQAVSDPSTQAWIPIPEPGAPYTHADAEQWCRRGAAELRATGDGQQWAGIERETGRFAGSFGLTRTRWKAMVTEVGYWVAPWARGRGLATEGTLAMARWALDQGFQRIELKAGTANTASRGVAERAGFTYEGTERNVMPLHEGRTDLAVYSLIPGDLVGSTRGS